MTKKQFRQLEDLLSKFQMEYCGDQEGPDFDTIWNLISDAKGEKTEDD